MWQNLMKLGVLLSVLGICLYAYLDLQNSVTTVKMQLPQKEADIRLLKEEIQRLSYQVEQFENPSHLIELAHKSEFSHLKHPVLQEILTVPEAFALAER